MKRCLLMIVASVICALFARADVADARLLEILERAISFIDNPDGGPGEVQYAIELTGNDTNRVVSLMKQLVNEGMKRKGALRFYISEIGKYGTSSDLPFLYQGVAASNLCEDATMAVLKIEGLTTNSLTQITTLLPAGRDCNFLYCSNNDLLFISISFII